MSSNYLSVSMCSKLTILYSTRFLMKSWWMSIWLILLCWTRFSEILMALKLSHSNVMSSCSTLYSFCIYFIQSDWVQLLLVAIYLASVVDRETRCSFLLNQEIKLLPKKKHPPDVPFLVIDTSILICITISYQYWICIMRIQYVIIISLTDIL